MANTNKATVRRAEVLSRRVSPADFGAQKTAQLAQLTERYFVLREQLARDAVETIREIGELLARGAEILPRGQYGEWLDSALGIGRSSAKNYQRVAELGRTTPAVFIDGKDLGPSKMIRLSRVSPDKRKLVLKQKLRGKAVAEMTDAEFAQVTKKYLEKRRLVTGNMRAHGLRMKVQSMTATLRQALVHPRAENREIRVALRADIADLIRAAKAAAGKAC